MRFSGEIKAPQGAEELKKGELKSLRLVMGYLKPYRVQLAVAILSMMMTTVVVLGLGKGLQHLVDRGIATKNADLLYNGYLTLLACVALFSVATYIRFTLVTWIGEKLVADLRGDIYKKLVQMDVMFFETHRTGDLLSRITTDTTLLQTLLVGSVAVALRNCFLFTGGVVLLFFTSAELTGYVGLIVPLVVIPIIILGRRLRKLSRDAQNKVAEVNIHAEETLSAIRTVRALALEDYESARFQAKVDTALQAGMRRIRSKALMISLVILLVLGAVSTVLWIGGMDVIKGNISAGELSSFIFYAVLVSGSVGAISEVFGDLQTAAGSSERLMELLILEPDIVAPALPAPLPARLRGEITFDNVTFCYPSRPDTKALEEFSLTVAPGETVALVGPSGAGKSTIFQLLLRFYDPSQGTLSVDGLALPTLHPQEYRRHIGLVPQDPVIFSADAWENIRCGNPTASKEEILAAARKAEALEFLEALPQGMDTYLGEKGVRISGGQRQRIAIARALVRNPDILLLDEATSALDSENEQKVQHALTQLTGQHTTLVIAHRLSTVQNADRIVVLDEGRIQSIGTHAELMQRSELYNRLATMQFSAAA